jgi:hypothetical protein
VLKRAVNGSEILFHYVYCRMVWCYRIAAIGQHCYQNTRGWKSKIQFFNEKSMWEREREGCTTKLFIVKKLLSDGDANRKSNPPLDSPSLGAMIACKQRTILFNALT